MWWWGIAILCRLGPVGHEGQSLPHLPLMAPPCHRGLLSANSSGPFPSAEPSTFQYEEVSSAAVLACGLHKVCGYGSGEHCNRVASWISPILAPLLLVTTCPGYFPALAPPSFPSCLRASPPCAALRAYRLRAVPRYVNEALLEAINAGGCLYLIHTELGGAFTLRLAVGSATSQLEHVEAAWREIQRAADAVLRRFSEGAQDEEKTVAMGAEPAVRT